MTKKYSRTRKLLTGVLIFILIITAGFFVFTSWSTSVTENIHTHVYSLPFAKGTKHKIAQGYGGLFSHQNIAALDFDMPEGTPVHAARGGVIYGYKDDSNEGGPFSKYKNKANYIMIKHDDGSFGCYWHLKKNGVVVKKGAVAQGQLIGYSGATGFTLQPHLHFSVKRVLNYHKNSFVRTKFSTVQGIKILENGELCENPAE
jgi:murein DD-endopeptidase MepM/ murein hydrolase activator NlpD